MRTRLQTSGGLLKLRASGRSPEAQQQRPRQRLQFQRRQMAELRSYLRLRLQRCLARNLFWRPRQLLLGPFNRVKEVQALRRQHRCLLSSQL